MKIILQQNDFFELPVLGSELDKIRREIEDQINDPDSSVVTIPKWLDYMIVRDMEDGIPESQHPVVEYKGDKYLLVRWVNSPIIKKDLAIPRTLALIEHCETMELKQVEPTSIKFIRDPDRMRELNNDMIMRKYLGKRATTVLNQNEIYDIQDIDVETIEDLKGVGKSLADTIRNGVKLFLETKSRNDEKSIQNESKTGV